MSNPWEEISLEDYENHMSLDSVKQLQAMNNIMKEQFEAYPVDTAMILGIAGGNGLEHVRTDKYSTVYAVDINGDYLKAVSERFGQMDALQCLNLDLLKDAAELPRAQLVIANLLIEYIGYEVFQDVITQVKPEYVSCSIQINTDEETWVSDSPYIHAFDGLNAIHHQMEEETLVKAMGEIGYTKIFQSCEDLPNGKALVRLDFKLEEGSNYED